MNYKDHIVREQRKIKRLATEYKQKGYKVYVAPQKKLLPKLIAEFEPDILVKKGDENILIEVKTTESLRRSVYLTDLAEKVESIKNWKFELVLTNPKTRFIEQNTNYIEFSGEELQNKLHTLKKSDHLIAEANLLYAWSLFLASARLLLKKEQPKIKIKPEAQAIIKQLFSYGIISKKNYDWLNNTNETIYKNSHGYKTEVSKSKKM